MSISPVREIVEELAKGKMVILVDEEDRENEGDLVMAAEHVTPEAINFMAKYGRGLICLTLTEAHSQKLNLRPMVQHNKASHGTNFTVSIEAATGVTTGISAADRAHTIQVAVAKHAKPDDLVQPGHIFPLVAAKGGVLMRAGHTEAGCDLAAMAGLTPASVICEIMRDDGTMARLPDLIEFAKLHQLKIGTIADLIHYRSAHESLVERCAEDILDTHHGAFRAVLYTDKPTGSVHIALVYGTLNTQDAQGVLVRVHEPTTVFDFLDIKHSVHAYSVESAMARIAAEGSGVLVLLNCQNSTTTDLLHQFQAFSGLKHANQNQADVEAAAKPFEKPKPSHNPDLRTYGIGAQILRDLGVLRMRLLAKPRKMPSMVGFDLEVVEYIFGE